MTLEPDVLLEWVPVAGGQRVRCDRCGLELKAERPTRGAGHDRRARLRARRASVSALCALTDPRGTERDCVLVTGTLAARVDGRGRSQVVLSGVSVLDRTDA